MDKFNGFGIIATTTAAPKAPRVINVWEKHADNLAEGLAPMESAANIYKRLGLDDARAVYVAAALVFLRPAYKKTVISKRGEPLAIVDGLKFKANVRRLLPFAVRAALKGELQAKDDADAAASLVNLAAAHVNGTAAARERFMGIYAACAADAEALARALAEVNGYDADFQAGRAVDNE